MRVPSRLVVALLLAVVGILSLVVAGLLDWIVGVLFLMMEFLGEVLRNVFFPRQERRRRSLRARYALAVPPHVADRPRRAVRLRGRPRRKRSGRVRDEEGIVLPEPSPPPFASPSAPKGRILVPLGRDDRDLLEFALGECRLRGAELLVLFLRPLAVTPMGPNPLPGLAEDATAQALFARVRGEADALGVPIRTLYQTTAHAPATIAEIARTFEADVVVVGAARRSRLARLLSRDPAAPLLKLLPEHTSLTIHAS